jgi:hypothetical protein
MRVGIEQVDGKWPNLALAKLAAWHRQQGDEVDWYSPLEGADRVYASQVFTGSEPSPYLPPDTIWGGSGCDIAAKLPDEIEAMRPDWSPWPDWSSDMGFSTRGCPRRCPFCNVYEKEGTTHVVAEFGDLWLMKSGTLILLDPNVLAGPFGHFKRLCAEATEAGVALDFSQGFDARILTRSQAAVIARSKLARRIHLAWDHMDDEWAVRRAIDRLGEAGVSLSRLTFYVLIGYDSTPEEDLYRVKLLDGFGVDPFVMPFNRTDPYQRRFARWVNRKELFRSCAFADFREPGLVRVEGEDE